MLLRMTRLRLVHGTALALAASLVCCSAFAQQAPEKNCALEFATGDAITVEGYANQMTEGFTIEAWIKPKTLSGRHRIVCSHEIRDGRTFGYSFGTMEKGLLFTCFDAMDYCTGNVTLEAGKWTHVAVTFDAKHSARFHVNGQLQETIHGEKPAAASSAPITISSNPNLAEYWEGGLDEVRIWSSVRSEAAIRADMGREMTGVEDGLLVCLPFAECSGRTTQNVVSKANAAVSATWIEGPAPSSEPAGAAAPIKNAALSFAPENCIELDGPANRLTEDMTIEAWIKPKSVSGILRIVCSHELQPERRFGYGFGIKDSGLRFTTYGVMDYDTRWVRIPTDKWTHVAVTYDTRYTARFYVNGRLEETIAGTKPAAISSKPITISAKPLPPGSKHKPEYWNGALDEIRIWSCTRTEAEIRDGMNRELTGAEDELVVYLPFPEGSGPATRDMVSKSQAGISGAQWVEGPSVAAKPQGEREKK